MPLTLGIASAQQPALSQERLRELSSAFWEPVNAAMIRWLGLANRSRVLDAGCGYGDHAILFASAGHSVTALDINLPALDGVNRRASKLRGDGTVTTTEGDIQRLPFEDGSFDLAWASHVLHGQRDYMNAARELRRAVRPRGLVVVREDQSTTSFLPYDLGVGRPGLEFRLKKAFLDWFLEDRIKRGRCPYGWAAVLRRAGLADVKTKSFLHEVAQPFSGAQTEYLEATLARWSREERVSREDRAIVQRLLNPAGPEYVFRREDLHFTAITTLYTGVVA